MDFTVFKDRLVAEGYADDTAYAKIAHDIVLKAVRDSGFHDNLTVKGGVVMSSLTDVVRRATLDMDLDFLRYPLANATIRRFVSDMNRVAPCKIRVVGKIETLRQQEYKGKRIHLSLTDETGLSIETKIDFGVHTRLDVEQSDRAFKVIVDDGKVSLLVNPNEQILVEKLKSLLRFGSATTRFKDIFDIYYLLRRVRRTAVKKLMKAYIFDDDKMRENGVPDLLRRLGRIFGRNHFHFQLLPVIQSENAAILPKKERSGNRIAALYAQMSSKSTFTSSAIIFFIASLLSADREKLNSTALTPIGQGFFGSAAEASSRSISLMPSGRVAKTGHTGRPSFVFS